MTTAADPAGTIDAYLQLCEDRDLQAAGRFLAPGAVLEFPGGSVFRSLEALAKSARQRYRWVRKHRDVFAVGKLDDQATVTSIGTLYGERLDGMPFDHVRYVDFFQLDNGLITVQRVWNDLAEVGIGPYAPTHKHS